MSLEDLHGTFGWVPIIANGVAGLWALAAHRHERFRHRSMWWFTAAAEISMFVQVALGVALLQDEGRTNPEFHTFYGFVALVTVGIVYSYRIQLRHRQYLLYGGAGLFIMGLGLRAVFLV